MKKIILSIVSVVLLLLAGPTKSYAQSAVYQGDAALGYGIGVGSIDYNRFNISTTHGFRINDYLFVGVGAGFNFYTEDSKLTTMPIFAAAKGYYPITDSFNLLATLNLGYGVNISDKDIYPGSGGFFYYPQIGVNFSITYDYSIDLTVGYHHQAISNNGYSANLGAFAFKAAFNW